MRAPGDVLIDDWPKYSDLWREHGGAFILHTSAQASVAELFALHPELARA